MRQAELARACEISPSYLNLIEHNRRRIGGALLVRIARAIDVDPAYLSGVPEVRLAADLDAAAKSHADVSPEQSRAEELASRYPGWARLIARQHRENRRLEQVIERLGDRLTHDPYLSASMHNVLTSVTAIRSASAILAQGGEIEPEWQARFHRNILEDSQRLTEATEGLVTYLDSEAGGESGGALPQDDLDRWLGNIDWRVDALEDDPTLDLDVLIGTIDALQAPATQRLARSYLERYAADVATLPKTEVTDHIANGGTAAALAQQTGAPLPVVFRRYASLGSLSAPKGESYGLVACDASGTLTFRKPLPGFDLPRYSAACPFWPLFAALQRPMTPLASTLVMSGRDETRFKVQAFAELRYPAGFDGPGITEAWMLIEPRMMGEEAATRVGTSCRICPEESCVARREPSVFL